MRKSPLPKLIALFPFLSACALCQQLQARTIIAGTLLHTPELANPVPGEAPLPEKTEVTVFIGDASKEITKPTPLASGGVTVRLVYPEAPDGLVLHPDPDAEGTWRITAEDGLLYLDEQEYRLNIVDADGEEYEMRVTLPKQSTGAGLDPAQILEQPRGEALSIQHPDPEQLAFVTVTRAPDVDPANPDPAAACLITDFDPDDPPIVFTTVPDEGDEVRDLIDNDKRWREDPLVIPGDTFGECGIYTVVVATMARGVNETTNLFIGSQFLAGKAEGGIFRVR